jgi:hypothetical protein
MFVGGSVVGPGGAGSTGDGEELSEDDFFEQPKSQTSNHADTSSVLNNRD